jgi:glycosyltransferase involved in cell wall biosynthesis
VSVDAPTVSVVIPVYRGARTLETVVGELDAQRRAMAADPRALATIAEVVLVHDCGGDESPEVMRRLAERHDWVVPVWLSRNYGQHAATLAGMSSTRGDWIVTMDEDGQHRPADLVRLLETAAREHAPLVYGRATGGAPHARWRNATSGGVKWLASRVLLPRDLGYFSSFRLVEGELGRSVGAYAGNGSYLDVALSWVVDRVVVCEVTPGRELRDRSGYSWRSLVGHFVRLVLSAGTRPLRIVSGIGVGSALGAVAAIAYVVYQRIAHGVPAAGWTSLLAVTLLVGGITMLSLGIVAEFLGIVVRTSIGRPLYLVRSDPRDGALARLVARRAADG